MPSISQVVAHQILDSRGTPTVEVHLSLDTGAVVTASAPSGASVGSHEAVELRDRKLNSFLGLSVQSAITSVNEILSPTLVGKDPTQQKHLDQTLIELDGTPNKSKLGANGILATSVAICKAAAVASSQPLFTYIANLLQKPVSGQLPTPMFNLINGGLHGTGNLDIQEFMVVPARRLPYSKALQQGDEIYLNLKELLIKKSLFTSVGDEGGFTPTLFTNASALDLLLEAIRVAGYTVGQDVFISLDVAANQLKHGDKYYVKDSSEPFSVEGLLTFYQNIVSRYSILSLEDPFSEDDWRSWRRLRELVGQSTVVVGDDLTVTDPVRLKQAIAEQAISGIIIKPNQIGTVTEALEVVEIAKENNITTIVSHRSGDTGDTFIADFAAGVGADYFKGGAPARGERVAKYNRFLEIEAQLAAKTS